MAEKNNIRIIGSGLVANALESFYSDLALILYAKGVSNSLESNEDNYRKEWKYLEEEVNRMNTHEILVYFSSISLFDSSKQDSDYVLHKRAIENYLMNQKISAKIIRLPNLVGKSSNPHTLTNFFNSKIKNKQPLSIYPNALRHLIDVADLPLLINQALAIPNKIVNVITSEPISISELITLFEQRWNTKCNAINNHIAIQSLANDFPSDEGLITFPVDKKYYNRLIEKYY